MNDRWTVHRGYGVRDTETGATLWCHNAEQEQDSTVAHNVAFTLNLGLDHLDTKYCGCGDELDARLDARCGNCIAGFAGDPLARIMKTLVDLTDEQALRVLNAARQRVVALTPENL